MLFAILSLICQIHVFASIYLIFPPNYSQFFNNSNPFEIKLSESFMSEEKNEGIFGFSFWFKPINEEDKTNSIFFKICKKEYYLYSNPQYIYSLLYSSSISSQNKKSYTISLQFFDGSFSESSISFELQDYWIFLGLSQNSHTGSLVFYFNQNGISDEITVNIDKIQCYVSLDSVISIENLHLTHWIADFKFYYNIFYDIYEWNLEYQASLSCPSSLKCSSSNIAYGICDHLCSTQPDWFYPLIQPTLWSYQPYLKVEDQSYSKLLSEIYPKINLSHKDWKDFSITGWFNIDICNTTMPSFIKIGLNWEAIYGNTDTFLYLELVNSNVGYYCDILQVRIADFFGTDTIIASSTSSNFLSNWAFFAVTCDSTSKILTLYTEINDFPQTIFPPRSWSVSFNSILSIRLLDSQVFIGGTADDNFYTGNFADFRLYPVTLVDNILSIPNNIISPATYLDPFCNEWKSIWDCKICQSGYFLKNGTCQKCHFACQSCENGDTDADCIICASNYYAQPEHSSICLNYCPKGYSPNSVTRKCIGSPGTIANINFDDNLLGDFISSDIYYKFGLYENTSYPEFEIFDPKPANKRGVFFDHTGVIYIIPKNHKNLLSSDFSLEMWINMDSNGGVLFSVSTSTDGTLYWNFQKDLLETLSFSFYNNQLNFKMLNKDGSMQKIESSQLEIHRRKNDWAFYAFSIGFEDIWKLSKVTVMKNTYFETHSLEYFYREITVNSIKTIGHSMSSFSGFLYSFTLFNYKKSSSQMIINLGTCQECSACPISLNHCLPNCLEHQYVDSNGNCQDCLNSCKWPCSRPNTCNLCNDDLCYLCTKYEVGACIKCVDHAILNNGVCECENGYFKDRSLCTDTCKDGFFFDFNLNQCISCPKNCKSCSDQETCKICFSGFILEKNECRCPEGYFLDSNEKCSQCDKSCITCSIKSTNCESCAKDFIIFGKNACYPCEVFQGYGKLFSISLKNFTNGLSEGLSKSCKEICGDGKNMGEKQCDDGNNYNGDGCSENCKIEYGWSCSGGSMNSPDTCKDTTPPYPILSYLNQNDEGFSVLLSFSELVYTNIEMEKNIEITIENIKKFEWALELKNNTYIINLVMYESISSGTKMFVAFLNPEFIIDKSENHMNQTFAEIILGKSFTYKLGQAMKSSITTIAATAIASGLSISIFSSNVNLQGIWGMIEMMQTQNYLIFLSINYPENLKTYLSALGIANGNFLPNPFQIFFIKNDPFPDPPEAFLNENFNTDFLMNSGEFIGLWIAVLIGFLVSIILYKLFPKYRFVKWLKKSYFYSFWLRVGIESFLGLCLSAFLQWRELNNAPNKNLGYFSIILSFLVFIYIIITYALVIWQVSIKNTNELNKKSQLRRFGVLYENFKKDKTIKSSFLLFQNTRRMLFTVICVFLYEFTEIQAVFSFLLTFLYSFSLIILKPYNSFLGNIMNISGEILYFLSHCIILKFMDSNLLNRESTNLGWVAISLLSLSLLIHLIGNFIEQIQWVISAIGNLKDRILKNFHNKFFNEKKRIILDSNASMMMTEDEISRDVNYNTENKEFCMDKNNSNEQFSSVIYTIQEESCDEDEIVVEDL